MTTLKEIIHEASLGPRPQREFPSLEIVSGLEIPKTMFFNSLEDLNTLCREMDFPVIEERMMDDHSALIDALNNLSIEYGRYGLTLLSLDEIKEKQRSISLYDEYERECDVLEIDLANLKREYDKMCEYKRNSVEALRTRLDEVKRTFSNAEYERTHSDIIARVFTFLSGEGCAEDAVIGALGYVKQSKEYSNVIEKMSIMKEIESMPYSHNKFIFKRLIDEETVALDDLEKTLSLDRTALLKIVYSLLSRNIILFDRSRDTISLRK